ncbi:hypothetical protein N7493_010686 [Penicillium malachiteum]|uniref:Shelterin complex subunit TPP1/Est3 domain-containing protein n=1 Tax=Penicillium malachiteum TaxID=1324776 RepID=A0AAD6HDA6_9EURO|nr:hypothetical protein N7493_010686 [Penicillium malachiteum]
MNPDTPWIVSFIQQAFSQYPNQAEDDGTHLSFGNNGKVYIATVQEWGVGPSGHGAVLKDSEHQIEAILSRGTQSFYDSASNSYQEAPFDVRNHLIKLLDFKLVFAYKETVPQVHLVVNEFSIDIENGKSKNVVPKKKLMRNQAVRSLMESMHQQIPRSPKTARPGKSRDHTVRNTPTQTPTKGNALGGFGSQGFSSQMPSNQNAFEQLAQAPAPLQTLFAGNDSREALLKLLSSAGGAGQAAPKPTSNTGDCSTPSSVARPPINSHSRDSNSDDDEGSIHSQGEHLQLKQSPCAMRFSLLPKSDPEEHRMLNISQLFMKAEVLGLRRICRLTRGSAPMPRQIH